MVMIKCRHCGRMRQYNGKTGYTNCTKCGYKILGIFNGNDDVEEIPTGRVKYSQTLTTKGDRAWVIPISDVHIGAPKDQCDIDKFLDTVDYVLSTDGCYTIFLGDLMDNAQKQHTRGGPNVYLQSMPPQRQYDLIYKYIKPLAKAGKIIGIMPGNHDAWTTDFTGLYPMKIMADSLGVPFLNSGCHITLSVNRFKYSIYAFHGTSGAKMRHTKMGALIGATKDVFADVLMMGHVHQTGNMKGGKFINGQVRKCYYVLTGHFLDWTGSYAQTFGMDICPAGVEKVKLFTDRWDFFVSE